MENHAQRNTPIPADCFGLEEVKLFQSLENEILAGINYYLWLNTGVSADTSPYRFLLALELLFESGQSLLLSSGEDSEAVQVLKAEKLLETAKRLQALHGQSVMQRLARNEQGFWPGMIGKPLQAIQLSRHESGLYRNDALLLDFSSAGVVVELSEEGEGLEIREV